MKNNYTDVHLSKPLTEYCKNASNKEGDTFVGIKSELIDGKHEINVYFPIGYEISKKEEAVRDVNWPNFKNMVTSDYNAIKNITLEYYIHPAIQKELIK